MTLIFAMLAVCANSSDDPVADRKFGAIFDKMIRRHRNSEDHPKRDFCTKKHLIDIGMLDDKVYKVELNPKSLNTENVHCEEVLAEVTKKTHEVLIKRLSSSLTPENQECVMSKYDESKHTDRLMLLTILGQLEMSVEQLQAERVKFTDMMKAIATAVEAC